MNFCARWMINDGISVFARIPNSRADSKISGFIESWVLPFTSVQLISQKLCGLCNHPTVLNVLIGCFDEMLEANVLISMLFLIYGL